MWIRWNLSYVVRFNIRNAVGIDIGDSVHTATKNLADFSNVIIIQDDMINPRYLQGQKFDIVYSIGVLHHLKSPEKGFDSIIRHVKSGGRFHCWVYAKEGNEIIRFLVEPIRKIASRLPWFLNKYCIALPLSIPFSLYSKMLGIATRYDKLNIIFSKLPLSKYMQWISKTNFKFHHHVAFDQLVSPCTHFIEKKIIEEWLTDSRILADSTYIIFRNNNGWKFGGQKR